jgi:DNA-binding NarL/FixJ family response regulator
MLLSSRSLFRESLRDLLSRQPQIQIVGSADSENEATELLKELDPDAILIDRGDTTLSSAATRLLNTSASRIVEVAMEDRGLTVYSRRRISNATPEDLVMALSGMEALA